MARRTFEQHRKANESLLEKIRKLSPVQTVLVSSTLTLLFCLTSYVLYYEFAATTSIKMTYSRPIGKVLNNKAEMCVGGPAVYVGFAGFFPIIEEIKKVVGDSCNGFYTMGGKIQNVPYNEMVVYDDYLSGDGEVPFEPKKLQTVCPGNDCMLVSKYEVCKRLSFDDECSYFTFLEDPLERIITMYVKFCINGEGGERFWENKKLRMGIDQLTCPNVSFLDFVAFFGNVYVKEFSGMYAKEDCGLLGAQGAIVHEEICGKVGDTTDVLLARAKRIIKNNVLIFIMDEYFEGLESLSYIMGGKSIQGAAGGKNSLMDKKLTPQNIVAETGQKFSLTKSEIRKAAKIMQHDIQFYQDAVAYWKANYKDIAEREEREEKNSAN